MRLKTLKLVKSAYFSPYGHSKKSALIQKNVRLILINFQPTQFFNPRNSADGNNILLIASKADILKENVLKLNYETAADSA